MSQHNHVIVSVVHCTKNLSTRPRAVTDALPLGRFYPAELIINLLLLLLLLQLMITLITLARIIPRGKEDIDEEGEAARSSGNSAVIAAAHLL